MCFLDKPTVPLDVHVTSYSRDSVTVAWSVPEDDGGVPVTSYLVERRDVNRTSWIKTNEVPANTLTSTTTKLVEGNQYLFRVAAINAVGQGPEATINEPVTAKCSFGE